jgi:hypothetical protein
MTHIWLIELALTTSTNLYREVQVREESKRKLGMERAESGCVMQHFKAFLLALDSNQRDHDLKS